MRRTAALVVLVMVGVLGACGGGSTRQSAADIMAALGCPDGRVMTRLPVAELPRLQRGDCHGLDVLTFQGTSQRKTYVKFVLKVDQAFGSNLAVDQGDTWAVMGPPPMVRAAQRKFGGNLQVERMKVRTGP